MTPFETKRQQAGSGGPVTGLTGTATQVIYIDNAGNGTGDGFFTRNSSTFETTIGAAFTGDFAGALSVDPATQNVNFGTQDFVTGESALYQSYVNAGSLHIQLGYIDPGSSISNYILVDNAGVDGSFTLGTQYQMQGLTATGRTSRIQASSDLFDLFADYGAGPIDGIGIQYKTGANKWFFVKADDDTSVGTNPLAGVGFIDIDTGRESYVEAHELYTQGIILDATGENPLGWKTTDADGTVVFGKDSSNSAYSLQVRDGSGTIAGGNNIFAVRNDGNIEVTNTITAAGTTGDRTINKASGAVNFAALATSLTVTNSLVTTSSRIFTQVRGNGSLTMKQAFPSVANGSFVLTADAAPSAEVRVDFWVLN